MNCIFSVFSGNIADKESGSQHQAIAWSQNAHVSAIKELLPALDLFLKVINNDLPDMSPSREFCLRLLIQTLEFLHQLLKDGLIRQSQLGGTERELMEKEDLDEAMEVVMGYVSKLRDAMLADELKEKRVARSVTVRSGGSASLDMEAGDSVSADSVDALTPSQGIYSEVSVWHVVLG